LLARLCRLTWNDDVYMPPPIEDACWLLRACACCFLLGPRSVVPLISPPRLLQLLLYSDRRRYDSRLHYALLLAISSLANPSHVVNPLGYFDNDVFRWPRAAMDAMLLCRKKKRTVIIIGWNSEWWNGRGNTTKTTNERCTVQKQSQENRENVIQLVAKYGPTMLKQVCWGPAVMCVYVLIIPGW